MNVYIIIHIYMYIWTCMALVFIRIQLKYGSFKITETYSLILHKMVTQFVRWAMAAAKVGDHPGSSTNRNLVFSSTNIWVCLKMLCTPKNPMVLLIIIPMKNGYFIGAYPIFRHTHMDMAWVKSPMKNMLATI